jgi:hypothetical protein
VVLPGEEVTNTAMRRPLHVNALCARTMIGGGIDFVRADVGLAAVFAEIRSADGVPLIDHPNFHFAINASDIATAARGRYLLEIWSGHPDVNPEGNALHPSAETIWDEVLARGGEAFPAAVDDAHGIDETESDALPGRGWVETFGDETSVASICAALADGRLYASNGPAITRLRVQDDAFVVATTDARAVVTFVGEWGETLAERRASDAAKDGDAYEVVYRLTGDEALVRARVSDPEGRHAWTAAYRVSD